MASAKHSPSQQDSFTFTQLQSSWLRSGYASQDPVPFSAKGNAWGSLDEHRAALLSFSLFKCLEFDINWEDMYIDGDPNARNLVSFVVETVAAKLISLYIHAPNGFATNSQNAAARSSFVRSLLSEPITYNSDAMFSSRYSYSRFLNVLAYANRMGRKTDQIPCVNRTINTLSGRNMFLPPVYSFFEAIQHGYKLPRNAFPSLGDVICLKFSDNENANHMTSATSFELNLLVECITEVMSHPDFSLNKPKNMVLTLPSYLQGNVCCFGFASGFSNLQSETKFYNHDDDATRGFELLTSGELDPAWCDVLHALVAWTAALSVSQPGSAGPILSQLAWLRARLDRNPVQFVAPAETMESFLNSCNGKLNALNRVVCELCALSSVPSKFSSLGVLRIDVSPILVGGGSDPEVSFNSYVLSKSAARIGTSVLKVLKLPFSVVVNLKTLVVNFPKSKL